MEALKDMKNIPISVVAEILGMAKHSVRLGLQRNELPIGSAIKTSSRYNYHVSYELLKNYVGIERIKKYEESKS